MTGTVKNFDTKHHWGFIRQESGPDVFFHEKNCFEWPSLDDQVSFDLRFSHEHPGKMEAVNVRVSPR